MKEYQLNKPILFLVFNRPETTKKVFTAIRNAKPPRLYIASDGPRPSVISDRKACDEVRALIMDHIDWECEVKTLLREENLGCRLAVSSAIDWFFENEEDGIILEDDCLPHPDFFRFCEELLNYYKDDERVMHIGGSNHQNGIVRGNGDYYFSNFTHIWGWASWRRAWKHYDIEMSGLDKFESENLISSIFPSKAMQKRWLEILHDVQNHKIDTWDFQWNFTVICNHGLGIIPNINMVENIGFETAGTNVNGAKSLKDFDFSLSDRRLSEITHPEFMLPSTEAEILTFNEFKLPLKSKLKRALSKIL